MAHKNLKHVTLLVVDHAKPRVYCARLFDEQLQLVKQLSTPRLPVSLTLHGGEARETVTTSELFGYLIGEPQSDPCTDTWTQLPHVKCLYGVFALHPTTAGEHRLFQNTTLVYYDKSDVLFSEKQ